jgi:predicted RNase H-like HicB family nuclease
MKPTKTKDLDYYLNLHYKIELLPQEDGSWGAVIPELPGCVGGGDTIAEALEMLEDAKRGWFMSSLKHGDSIPEPILATTQ